MAAFPGHHRSPWSVYRPGYQRGFDSEEVVWGSGSGGRCVLRIYVFCSNTPSACLASTCKPLFLVWSVQLLGSLLRVHVRQVLGRSLLLLTAFTCHLLKSTPMALSVFGQLACAQTM